MNRKEFIKNTGVTRAGIFLCPAALIAGPDFPVVRTPLEKQHFNSTSVEKSIADFSSVVKDKELAWLFGNCFPNTLDTTVYFNKKDGRPDTYVITGDIDAKWLRDSTAQVWPYFS